MTATTTAAAVPAVPATSTVLGRLARIEALRYARHPLFLAGFVLALASSGTYGPEELDHQVVPAFFIGVLGVVVASRLATATAGSASVVASTPVAEPVRTAALCLACAVPAAAGLVVVLVHRLLVLADPPAEFEYAGYGSADRLWITIAIPLVASAGGPLLGVLLGRWLRFRGATMLAVVVLLAWCQACAYYPAQQLDADSWFARVMHVFTPYTAFAETNSDGNGAPTLVTAYTGSPPWFLVWTVALCALAALGATVRGSTDRLRQILVRWFAGTLVVAVVSLSLGVTTGRDTSSSTPPTGRRGW